MGPCPICGTGWGGLHRTLSVFMYGGQWCCVCCNEWYLILYMILGLVPLSVVTLHDYILPRYIDPYFPHTMAFTVAFLQCTSTFWCTYMRTPLSDSATS